MSVTVTIATSASDFTGEMGDLDQPSTKNVESTEVYTFSTRGDASGMPELALADRIRNFVKNESLG